MTQRTILHHTGLECSGGATRVARLLLDGLAGQGADARLSFEHAEREGSIPTLPADFGDSLADGFLPHVHCTGNWPELLASMPEGQEVVITLHDCELFTGGCPYPLHCPTLDEDCANPCPRRFSRSAEIRKLKHQLLDRLSPVLVAPSRWLARLAKSHLFRNVMVIPNGIPWPERTPSKREARAALGIHPAVHVVLFAAHGGTGAAYKSGDRWLDIWKEVKRQVPETLGFAVGGDAEGREGDLVIWPYVERDRLGLLMAAADLLLYPTRADNHSLVILEAMAHSLPVVSFDVGGVSEQILNDHTGALVPAGDMAAFVETSVRLLKSSTLLSDMGRTAFSTGQRRFTVERMVRDYDAVYRKFE
ncbi:glycosyltransferase [uncultured Pseudodesulfovibrio sp.]|uniref:glycosyltransferase n=1 Tax=uncultured Pseudodesulfovibrio sp. TaxID=2035858 RepID=UPI0029C94733|nr:glycosyltransferase [uncultured Pseudodesulfovibrio sp.]